VHLDLINVGFAFMSVEAIHAIFSPLKNLKFLRLRKCNLIDMSDAHLSALFDSLPMLQDAIVSCSGDMLDRIHQLFPHLKDKVKN